MMIKKEVRDKIAVALGSSLDWYDFALYSFFSFSFSRLFFPPNFSQKYSLFLTYAIFFVSFLSRPIGSIFFGYIGDKYGRVKCFKLTSILILLPVIIFPFLPTYNHIGPVAPIIVLLLRVIQGICIGGEFAGTMIYLCETSAKKQNYFYGSLGSCTGSFGILLASIVAGITNSCLDQVELDNYGWRIAFSIAIIFAFISYRMRKIIKETQEFNRIKNSSKNKNFTNIILKEYKSIIQACGIIFMHATSFYMLFIFLPTFLNKYFDIDNNLIFINNSFLLLLRILIIPLIGYLSDEIGGKNILRISCLLFFTLSYFLFALLINNSKQGFIVALISFALMTTLNAGTVPGLLIKIFPTEIRYSAMSIAFNICFGVFGGIVPILSIYLIDIFSSKIVLAYYLMFSAVITFTTLQFWVKKEIL